MELRFGKLLRIANIFQIGNEFLNANIVHHLASSLPTMHPELKSEDSEASQKEETHLYLCVCQVF